jgi:allantoate deiminase
METITAEHGTELVITKTYSQAVTPCDPMFRRKLAEASQDFSAETIELSSGAFHDASAMADLCPVAMLFVRCHQGISHHPDEMVNEDDMARAVEVLKRFLLELDPYN